MADTAEGITVGEQSGLNPNNPADFAAIMEGRGVPKTDEDTNSPDRSIASGLTVDEPGQLPARDGDTGRFVSTQEKAAAAPAAPAAATDTSGADGDQADPEVAAFLAKYNGNVEEALKGAANAQALIGRRDEDRTKLETELAEMRGQLQGLMAGGIRPAAPALSDDQVVEVATGRIETLGYAAAAEEAANIAHTQNDERAYRSIMEQWLIEDPMSATDFNTDFRIWQREQKAAPAAQPAWAQTVADQVAVDGLTKSITAIAAERGVPNDSPIIAQMLPALEQMPQNIGQMIDSDDPEAVAAGLRIVMDRATVLAGTAAPAATPVEEGVPAAVARKLAGAAVASGALRPPAAAPASAPETKDAAIREFKRQIVEAPTTSIASGLTYGPTP